MSEKIVIDIALNTANSANSVKEIKKSVNELTEALNQVGEGSEEFNKITAALNNLNKKLADTSKAKESLGGVAKGFNGIGLAIKASGIGLVIGLFAALKEVLSKQQPILDAIDTAFTAIGIVITQVTEALTAAFKSTSDANGGFDATTKVISGLLTIALYPLKLIIDGIKLAVIGAQLIWEKSFFGKGDPEKIKSLEKSLVDVKDDIVDISKAAGNAVIEVASNVGEAVGEVTDFVSTAADNISKISVSAAIEQAKRTTELKNQAKIGKAINDGLIDQYDQLAEKQKQLRDDETLSIADRIKANDQLAITLKEQEKLMLKNADIGVQAAQLELQANNTIENKVKLIEAQNQKTTIKAQIETKNSEQLKNSIALDKEALALNQAQIDGTIKRSKEERDATTDAIKNDNLRLATKKINLHQDEDIELARLQAIIDSTNAGTSARVEAEQKYLDAKSGFAQQEIKLNKEIDDTKAEQKKVANEKALEVEKQHNANLLAIANAAGQSAIDIINFISDLNQQKADEAVQKNAEASDAKIASNNAEKDAELAKEGLTADQKTAINNKYAQEEYKIKLAQYNADLVTKKKAFEDNKKLAIASALIAGALGVVNALGATPFYPLAIIGIATAVVTTALNVAKISQQKFNGGGSPPTAPNLSTVASNAGVGGPNDKQGPRLNDFSLFGTAGKANNIGTKQEPTVVKAVVVESDITTTQARVAKFKTASEL